MKQVKGSQAPRFWQTAQWSSNPVGFMEKSAAQFPDLFKAKIAPVGKYQVLLVHPQAIQELFTRSEFVNGVNSLVRPVFGDESLLLQVGDSPSQPAQVIDATLSRRKDAFLRTASL